MIENPAPIRTVVGPLGWRGDGRPARALPGGGARGRGCRRPAGRAGGEETLDREPLGVGRGEDPGVDRHRLAGELPAAAVAIGDFEAGQQAFQRPGGQPRAFRRLPAQDPELPFEIAPRRRPVSGCERQATEAVQRLDVEQALPAAVGRVDPVRGEQQLVGLGPLPAVDQDAGEVAQYPGVVGALGLAEDCRSLAQAGFGARRVPGRDQHGRGESG